MWLLKGLMKFDGVDSMVDCCPTCQSKKIRNKIGFFECDNCGELFITPKECRKL